MRASLARIAGLCALLAGAASAEPGHTSDFYAGKTIVISTHSAPGGQYDAYLRLLARYFGTYIPGAPQIVVMNEPGAGGLLAINHAALNAPQDGTFLTLAANGLLLFEGLRRPGLQVSMGSFHWLGNFSASNSVTVLWAASGARSIEDARRRELIIGSSGAGSISALLPAAYNALAGTKLKVVYGYEGAAQMNLALRRGEIQGRSGSIWADFTADFPKETATGSLIPISQAGKVRDKALPNVPLLTELVGADPRNLAAARFVSDALTQNRALAAPPGAPANRVDLLRTAFEKTVADPAFRAEAKKERLDLNPTTGVEVQSTVDEILRAPPDLRDYLSQALARR